MNFWGSLDESQAPTHWVAKLPTAGCHLPWCFALISPEECPNLPHIQMFQMFQRFQKSRNSLWIWKFKWETQKKFKKFLGSPNLTEISWNLSKINAMETPRRSFPHKSPSPVLASCKPAILAGLGLHLGRIWGIFLGRGVEEWMSHVDGRGLGWGWDDIQCLDVRLGVLLLKIHRGCCDFDPKILREKLIPSWWRRSFKYSETIT